MKVEFAAGPGATPAPPPSGPKRHAPRIATQSKLDIERELEKLRQVELKYSFGEEKKGAKNLQYEENSFFFNKNV